MVHSPDIAEVAAMLRELDLPHTVGSRLTEWGSEREYVRCNIGGCIVCYEHNERRSGVLRIEDPDAQVVRAALAVAALARFVVPIEGPRRSIAESARGSWALRNMRRAISEVIGAYDNLVDSLETPADAEEGVHVRR